MYPRNAAGPLRLALALLLVAPMAVPAAPLTLDDAERLARGDDPTSQRLRELAAARQEAAIAAGQLPDPQLIIELMDIPTDSFRPDRDEMSQLRLGLRQSFPRGASRQLAADRERALGEAESARADGAERSLTRAVRRAYLELYYQRRTLAVLEQSRGLFTELMSVTEREFAAGRASSQDLLRAELELERLEDRVLMARTAKAGALAELTRWVGAEAAGRPLTEEFPSLAPPTGALEQHPALAAEDAGVRAGRHGVELSRQAYRPQFSVELSYGRSLGWNADMEVPDRLSGMVMLDLPLFGRNRQDRDLAASVHRRQASELAHEERLRQLQQQLTEAQARWQRLSEREQRFGQQLLPRAQSNAEAAEQAYRAGTADFTALMRARLMELETRLDALRISTERRLAQADLLYLLGEE